MLPNSIPNLNHKTFKGVKTLEFINPKIKKNKEKENGIFLIKSNDLTALLSIMGQIAIIKNITKNTRPKLLFEPLFILFLSDIF